ncbi:MAG: Ldh family oxidoreductase [Clostridia bacterium]|nr:Ldh family oxidoreductase [Clostridia bacterium]
MSIYKKDEIKAKTKNVLLQSGLEDNSAEVFAEYMTQVELYGVKSHGLKTLKAHLKKIESGGYNLTPSFQVKKETSAFAVIDGDNAIGMLSGIHCVDYAVKKAKESGVFTTFSFNNNTYGAAFYYALRAAQKGCICFTMSNSPAQMAAAGGCEKILGTNPFSIAIPAKNNHPIVVDMATSVVAKSKINEYAENGLPIPDGWALDANGKPTTDAKVALNGLMQPMAGFKGYGMSMMIDILTGVISGASYLGNVGRFYNSEKKCMDVGFTFIVINPKIVYGTEFYSEMDSYINSVRTGKNVEGMKISIPGDDRLDNYRRNLKNGIYVSDSIWEVQ